MEMKALYGNFDDSTDPYSDKSGVDRPIAIKPAWKSSKIFEPHSVTYVSPQPTDRFNFIALVILLQGMALFLPTNMFINAETFFRDFKFSDINNNIENNSKPINKSESLLINNSYLIFYYGITSSTSSLIAILFNVLLPISPIWSLTRRITLSVVFQALVISSVVILTIANTSDHQIIYLFITITSIILLNVSNGVFQTCIHAMTAFLPINYGKVLIFGIYFGGVLMSGLQILSISLIENQRFAYIYYFVASILVLLVCFDFYYTSSLSRFYRYYKNKTKGNVCKEFDDFLIVESSKDWSLFSILSKTWKHYLNIYVVCLVSYSIYPSIQVNVEFCDSISLIPNKLLKPIASHLMFNTFSALGSWITNLQNSETHLSSKLLALSSFRVLFIPFYIFCNLRPESRRLPVLVENDFIYLFANSLFGLSNGYLMTVSAVNAPKCVKPEQSFTTGMLSALFMMFGLMSGSIVSLILVMFVI